ASDPPSSRFRHAASDEFGAAHDQVRQIPFRPLALGKGVSEPIVLLLEPPFGKCALFLLHQGVEHSAWCNDLLDRRPQSGFPRGGDLFEAVATEAVEAGRTGESGLVHEAAEAGSAPDRRLGVLARRPRPHAARRELQSECREGCDAFRGYSLRNTAAETPHGGWEHRGRNMPDPAGPAPRGADIGVEAMELAGSMQDPWHGIVHARAQLRHDNTFSHD